MNSQLINLLLSILSGFYLSFGLFYFCGRILPHRHKISLPLFFCLSLFLILLFWLKRQAPHFEITILLQIATLLPVLFLFEASPRKKAAVYFIFYLLVICPEILCTSIFIELHNFFVPADIYTPQDLIVRCSSGEYLIIELSNILVGLFLFWKISEILQQCIDHLKATTFLQLLLPLIIPPLLNVTIALQKNSTSILVLSIIYWISCIGSYLLFVRAIHVLDQQHREYLLRKAEIELIKKQMNDSVKLSNEYSRLRKWNHDIENHMMSVRYLMESQKYEETKQYMNSVLSQFNQIK